MLGGSAHASLAEDDSIPCGQKHIDQDDLRKHFEHLARFVAESGVAAHRRQRLPQHIRQEADQDVRLDTIRPLVPQGPNL